MLTEFRRDARSSLLKIVKVKHELAWIIAGQGLVVLGTALGIKFLTNVMSLEMYGQLAIGISIAGIINMLIYGPIANAVLRFHVIVKEKNDWQTFFLTIISCHKKAFWTLLFLGVPAVIITRAMFGGNWALLVAASLLFGVFNGWNATLLSFKSAARQRKSLAMYQAAETWLRPIAAGSLVYFVCNTGYIAALGFAITAFIIFAHHAYFSFKPALANASNFKPYSAAADSESFYAYTRQFLWVSLFGAIATYADKWFLLGMLGEAEIGTYAAILQIATAPISILMSVASQLIVPILFERAGGFKSEERILSSNYLLLQAAAVLSMALIILTAGTYFFSQEIVNFFTTAEIARHHYILWPLLIMLGLSGVAELLAVIGFNRGNPKIYIYPRLIQSVFFIAMSYAFIRQFGLAGAAIAGCVANIAYLIAVILANRKINA